MQLIIRDLRECLLIYDFHITPILFAILLYILIHLYCLLSQPFHGGVGLLRRIVEENLRLLLWICLVLDAVFTVERLFWIRIVGLCLWKRLLSLRSNLEARLFWF